MAKTDYGPEIKSSMQETPADRARDKARGIKEGSPQDKRIDAMSANQPQPARSVNRPTPTPPGPQAPRAPGASPPPAMQPNLNNKPADAIPDAGQHHIPNMQMSMMPDMQRVNHAAGIAHAILGGRKMQ